MTFASTRDVQTVAAFLLAQTGDAEQAQKMSDDLARRYPLDTLINGYWLPTIRAAIELDLNHPAEAIEVLQAADPRTNASRTHSRPNGSHPSTPPI